MSDERPPAPSLERRLGLRAAIALVVGEVIGVGIFLTPAGMVRGLGSPFWTLLVWLLVGATAFCGALSFGEWAARFPEAGGGYVYLREAWGPGVAFLYGWKSLLVLDPGLTAALGSGLARYAGYLVPLRGSTGTLLAIGVVLLLALLNVLGVGIGSGVLSMLTALKLALLALIIVWGFASGAGHWSHFLPFVARRPGSPPLVAALCGGLVAAFFSFGGFWDVAKLGGEVRNPTHTLPLALGFGVALVTLVYVLTSGVFVYLIPIDAVMSTDAFAARVGEILLGSAGGQILSVVVIVAVLGSLAALLLASPRVYYAMARDGAFLRSVGKIHPRFGTPARAICVQAVAASLLLLLGTFDQIVAYFIFVTVVFVALIVAGLFRLPRPDPAAYRVPGYPWTPLAFVASLLGILIILGAGAPREAFLGTLVVCLGIPVYYLLVRPRPKTGP